jgi:hypothetical protein
MASAPDRTCFLSAANEPTGREQGNARKTAYNIVPRIWRRSLFAAEFDLSRIIMLLLFQSGGSKMRGPVEWFNNFKGYGFIGPDGRPGRLYSAFRYVRPLPRSSRLLKNSFQAQVRDGQDFQSCHKCGFQSLEFAVGVNGFSPAC